MFFWFEICLAFTFDISVRLYYFNKILDDKKKSYWWAKKLIFNLNHVAVSPMSFPTTNVVISYLWEHICMQILKKRAPSVKLHLSNFSNCTIIFFKPKKLLITFTHRCLVIFMSLLYPYKIRIRITWRWKPR